MCRLDQLEAHSHNSTHARLEAYPNVDFLSSVTEAESAEFPVTEQPCLGEHCSPGSREGAGKGALKIVCLP